MFRIYLPGHDGSALPEAAEGAALPVAGSSETILLVEDEPLILEMVTAMLAPLGYTVLAAATPAAALAAGARNMPAPSTCCSPTWSCRR